VNNSCADFVHQNCVEHLGMLNRHKILYGEPAWNCLTISAEKLLHKQSLRNKKYFFCHSTMCVCNMQVCL